MSIKKNETIKSNGREYVLTTYDTPLILVGRGPATLEDRTLDGLARRLFVQIVFNLQGDPTHTAINRNFFQVYTDSSRQEVAWSIDPSTLDQMIGKEFPFAEYVSAYVMDENTIAASKIVVPTIGAENDVRKSQRRHYPTVIIGTENVLNVIDSQITSTIRRASRGVVSTSKTGKTAAGLLNKIMQSVKNDVQDDGTKQEPVVIKGAADESVPAGQGLENENEDGKKE